MSRHVRLDRVDAFQARCAEAQSSALLLDAPRYHEPMGSNSSRRAWVTLSRPSLRKRALQGAAFGMLSLALGSWLVVLPLRAQAPAEPEQTAPSAEAQEEPAPTADGPAQPSGQRTAEGRAPASNGATAPAWAQPLDDEAQKALAARIEGLEQLATATLPKAPLETLLSVALDDDSSMIERDAQIKVEQRRLTVALNQAERAGTKTEAELQQWRDQLYALELEHKVLALPIEVRERLVQESAEAPAEEAPPPAPPAALVVAAPKPVAQPPQHKVQAPHSGPLVAPWVLFSLLMTGVFASARAARTMATKPQGGFPDDRRAQRGAWLQLLIGSVGSVAALLLSFELPTEFGALLLGALLLLVILAGKDVIASLLGGILLFVRSPFRVGDRIEIADAQGRVMEMGLLSVSVLNVQGRLFDIPNSVFISRHVAAATAVLAPLQIDFYLSSRSDITQAKELILGVARSTSGVDASDGRTSIIVSQVPVNGTVMLRLRARVTPVGPRPEHEIHSEISERGTERLRELVDAPLPVAPETTERDTARTASRVGTLAVGRHDKH